MSPSSNACEGLGSSGVAIVWLWGSKETSLSTSGKPWSPCLLWKEQGAGRLGCGRARAGEEIDRKEQFDKQILMKPPLGPEAVEDPALEALSPMGPAGSPPTYRLLSHPKGEEGTALWARTLNMSEATTVLQNHDQTFCFWVGP